ncbi:MAG TPA: hypothetical protein DCE77_11485 [Methylophaga sp.]|jgi:ketopantoate reductase|uniref:hypothetical protein n=1 Tax=unclassified Methylophaga TaxID=2629249 RepID=UPI000C909872|nr:MULTISPECIES: hypothetical protein [unclassified Methylophaga]MAP27742.1 hypothetical protein [Methylophaga sp.]HAD32188.1 hypothetical protein [Methylophaga sp.]HBX59865.1 hypothetical protein [Methylophaga sp.]|tara:strand:+ start:5287 stop:5511 length:225 start_codon:yes stop_codon:yes gene_type:complete
MEIVTDNNKVIAELQRQNDELARHRDILADHMAEVKAIADGDNTNTLQEVVNHCLQKLESIKKLRQQSNGSNGE